ncbi:hypothetical protein JCM8097_001804 [Rhodosporidiobolus ruineniae]
MPTSGYGSSFSLCLLSALHAPTGPDPVRARFVGRVIGTALPSGLVLLEDEGTAAVVEVGEVIRQGGGVGMGRAPPGVKERWMVWGEVERCESPLSIPPISAVLPSSTPPSIDPHLLVRATRLLPFEEEGKDGEVQMEEWREAVRGMTGTG